MKEFIVHEDYGVVSTHGLKRVKICSQYICFIYFGNESSIEFDLHSRTEEYKNKIKGNILAQFSDIQKGESI